VDVSAATDNLEVQRNGPIDLPQILPKREAQPELRCHFVAAIGEPQLQGFVGAPEVVGQEPGAPSLPAGRDQGSPA